MVGVFGDRERLSSKWIFRLSSILLTGQGCFLPAGLAKQSRIGRLPKPIQFKEFPDHLLCPVKCLQRYESVTSTFRKKPGHNHLFLGINSPHSPVVSSTIACWNFGFYCTFYSWCINICSINGWHYHTADTDHSRLVNSFHLSSPSTLGTKRFSLLIRVLMSLLF